MIREHLVIRVLKMRRNRRVFLISRQKKHNFFPVIFVIIFVANSRHAYERIDDNRTNLRFSHSRVVVGYFSNCHGRRTVPARSLVRASLVCN